MKGLQSNITRALKPTRATPYCDPCPADHGSLLVLEGGDEIGPLVKDVLTRAGYDIFPAGTRSEALNHLAASPIAATVLDWSTPEGGSVPVADYLLAHRMPYAIASVAAVHHLLPGHDQWAPFRPKPYTIPDPINAVEASRASEVPAARPLLPLEHRFRPAVTGIWGNLS